MAAHHPLLKATKKPEVLRHGRTGVSEIRQLLRKGFEVLSKRTRA
jgi:hypothetical protein